MDKKRPTFQPTEESIKTLVPQKYPGLTLRTTKCGTSAGSLTFGYYRQRDVIKNAIPSGWNQNICHLGTYQFLYGAPSLPEGIAQIIETEWVKLASIWMPPTIIDGWEVTWRFSAYLIRKNAKRQKAIILRPTKKIQPTTNITIYKCCACGDYSEGFSPPEKCEECGSGKHYFRQAS